VWLSVSCHTGAEVLYRRLAPFAGRLAVIHPGLTAIAHVDHALGQLCALTGDRQRAGEHFRSAISWCDTAGARTLAVRAQASYAEALFQHGEPRDRATAEALRGEAREAAAALGMHGIVRDLGQDHLEVASR
jgi:hypothetical protein